MTDSIFQLAVYFRGYFGIGQDAYYGGGGGGVYVPPTRIRESYIEGATPGGTQEWIYFKPAPETIKTYIRLRLEGKSLTHVRPDLIAELSEWSSYKKITRYQADNFDAFLDWLITLLRGLSRDPILVKTDASQPLPHERTFADREKEIANELANLPYYQARAKIRVGNRSDEYTILISPEVMGSSTEPQGQPKEEMGKLLTFPSSQPPTRRVNPKWDEYQLSMLEEPGMMTGEDRDDYRQNDPEFYEAWLRRMAEYDPETYEIMIPHWGAVND